MKRTKEEIYDELLVLGSQGGDEAAFGKLVARYQTSLLGHAYQLTGREEAAKDVVQDTWIAVVRGLSRLDDPARFAAFAHRILVRRCADWTRRKQRQRKLTGALEQEGPAREASYPDDATFRLRAQLDRLPSDRRTILSLHYLQDVPLSDIAALLRIPLGTVKSRLHHARQQLKRALEKE